LSKTISGISFEKGWTTTYTRRD